MRRRWIMLAELIALVGICAWVGYALVNPSPHPDNAVALKISTGESADHYYLQQLDNGGYQYTVMHKDGRIETLTPDELAGRLYRDEAQRSRWAVILNIYSPIGFLWVAVGFIGQVLFTGRMVVQWLASEKSKRSVVPPVFWWMSLIGSTMLLIYFLWRWDPVGVLGQAFGWFIYVRNLWLIYGQSGQARAAVGEDPAPEAELPEQPVKERA